MKPAITSSWRCFSFSLRQSGERRPGWYGDVDRLRDDALEAVLARCPLEGGAVVEGRREEDALDGRVEQLLERLPPLRVGEVDQRLAVPLEHVEGDEDERARALLQQPEAGAARLVEGADLAVEHGRRRADGEPERRRGGGKRVGEVVVVPAPQGDVAARDPRERAEAVPLRLERPALPPRQAPRSRWRASAA